MAADLRIAMLISGGGTTAAAIISACKSGRLRGVFPACVIASSTEAAGVQRVIAAGMPKSDVLTINPKNFSSAEAFGQTLLEACQKRGVGFVGQYGWLVKTPPNLIAAYPSMMTNQHPGPLDIGRPDFGGKGMFGLRVSAARLCFVKQTKREFWTEAAAQRVAINFDEGAVLGRRRVEILPHDTPETLAARLLPVEHEVQIETLRDFVRGAVKELVRIEPLVRPEEISVLEECKARAIKMYPQKYA